MTDFDPTTPRNLALAAARTAQQTGSRYISETEAQLAGAYAVLDLADAVREQQPIAAPAGRIPDSRLARVVLRQEPSPGMFCRICGQHLCSVDDGDELSVLAGVALTHVCVTESGDSR